MQDFEQGWRSISLYTGAPIDELQRAARVGEFACSDLDYPRVAHDRLDAWLLARLLGPKLLDDKVKLLLDLQQAS